MKSIRFLIIVVVIALAMYGIYEYREGLLFNRFTPIEMLKKNPEKYQVQQSATIKGVVLATTDFMGFSACKISDNTGKIYVLTNRGYREGDKVVIRGHIENMLGKSSLRWVVFVEDLPS